MTVTANILVVDDNEAGRFVRVQQLRRAGFRTTEAATGTEAIKLAAGQDFDLIVCDINLPDMSGLEVARRIKSSSAAAAIQVLHVSQTETSEESVARGLDTSSDAYLVEPVGSVVFLATVRSLLRLRDAEASLLRAVANEAEARQAAEEANRAKDEFLAMLSHELRTPLNTIMGWLWQLRREATGMPTFERAIDAIDRAAQLQTQIIRDLADVSLIERGSIEIDLAPVEVTAVVRPVIEDLQRRAAVRDIKVSLIDTPVTILADAARLDQIVTNIGNNALQYTGDEGHISVEVRVENGKAVIRVSDTGQGIAPEFLPHVFERFRRADARTPRHHVGLGLGLAIVRRLVEMHRGTVRVESEGIGYGTSVTVLIPTANETESINQPAEPTVSLLGVRILLVEDEPEPRELLTGALREAGALVIDAATGTDALELGQAHTFDLLVTDIGLPGLDGIGLMSRLRAGGFKAPAIALTAFATAAERARVMAAGFDTFLAKPAAPNVVIAAVARLLSLPPSSQAIQAKSAR